MQQTALRSAPHRQRASLPATSARTEFPSRGSSHGHSHELRHRVVSSLSSLGYAALTGVECEVDYGRIVLVGSVSSYHLKQMAQVAALRVAGVNRVDNRIVVTTP